MSLLLSLLLRIHGAPLPYKKNYHQQKRCEIGGQARDARILLSFIDSLSD